MAEVEVDDNKTTDVTENVSSYQLVHMQLGRFISFKYLSIGILKQAL